MHKQSTAKPRQRTQRAPRIRLAAMATLETQSTRSSINQALGAVKNLSRTGICIETGQPPLTGDRVMLRLAIDDRIHELKTTATRVTRRGSSNFYEVGLDWRLCSPEQLTFLDDLLSFLEAPDL